MIEIVKNSSIFDAEVETLVNPVNCVGVAGKGLALEFRKRFPENFRFYTGYCRREMIAGDVVTFAVNFDRESGFIPGYIFNVATKHHWSDKSNLEIIKCGSENLRSKVITLGIKSIAIPALGCGLGGLDFKDVLPVISKAFDPLVNVKTLIHEPQ